MKLLNKCLLVGSLVASTAFSADLATINDSKITEKDFKMALKALGPNAQMVATNPDMRKRFLDHLIDQQLFSMKGKTDKMEESVEYKTQLDFAKKEILARLALDKYIESNTKDSDLKKYFDKNKSQFEKDEVKAAHILMKDEKEADKILKEAMKKDADFAELAKKHSTGPSGPKGGDLGWFGKGRMVPEFETAAFATKKGTVHPALVKTQFGFHIIKVEDKKDGSDIKFEDNKDEIKNLLTKDLRGELLEELKKSAKIKVDEEKLKELKL